MMVVLWIFCFLSYDFVLITFILLNILGLVVFDTQFDTQTDVLIDSKQSLAICSLLL